MDAREILRLYLVHADSVTSAYLRDLSDEDMLVRPVPGANHIKWQLGHIILNQHQWMTALGAVMPPLPAGFEAAHAKAAAGVDEPGTFLSKQAYLHLLERCKDVTLRFMAEISPQRLHDPGPEAMRSYLPTVADVLSMLGGHQLLHAGQFAVVRRKLGKPIAI